MKLIKLSTDYIIVDDSEIKGRDWVFNEKSKEIYPITIIEEVVYYEKKITHSTDINFNEVYYIPLSEIRELTGEVDVEKKVRDYVQELIDCKSVKEHERTWISAICHKMYTQCLEDNKDRKYTEENVLMILQKTARKYFKEGREYKGNMAIAGDPLHGLRSELREYIQSLQPKTEWEVEIVDGKLKLKQ